MFSLIYIARHSTSGQLAQLSDYRITSRADLKKEFEPLKLHCPKCYLELNATHFEIWESVRLGVQRIVDKTNIDDLKEVCSKLI